MKQFFTTMAGVFVGLLLFFVGLPLLLIVSAMGAAKPAATPANTVLALDLREGLTDQTPTNPFSFGSGLSVMEIVQTLDRAERDPKVRALFIRLPESGMPPAAAEELAQAVKDFRASGKRVVAHSQGLYPAGVITATYRLGAAADELWMQENASFQAVGFANEELFFKQAFDRYGVVPDFQQRAAYKNAVNPYLYPTFTPEHREATLSWMNSVHSTAVEAAARDRRQNPQAFRAALEGGPYTAEAARSRGLIDRLGHVEQAREALADRYGDDANVMDFADYTGSDESGSGRPVVAVVEAEGPIITGDADDAGFGGGQTIYSDDVAKALYDAAEDDDVRAVVFRVSSPGGSDTASDQILAAVNAVRKAGKPVVVSMGTYAASGGYWIASQADRIVAQPSTLTGSIGVYGGKLAFGPALERFGVNAEGVNVGGEFSAAYDIENGFSETQRAAFSALIDETYREFVGRVASGRKLDPARVNQIAQGRVWTGVQARELGLVDEIGGFFTAVQAAKKLARIDADDPVRFKRLPAAKGPFEALEEMFGVSAQSARTLAAAGWLLGDPRAAKIMDGLAEARLRSQGANVLASTPLD